MLAMLITKMVGAVRVLLNNIIIEQKKKNAELVSVANTIIFFDGI